MERLQQSDPNAIQPLSDEKKGQLAEVDVKYRSKIAEKELFLNGKLQEARQSGDREGAEQIHRQLCNERIRLEEERDARKAAIRANP